MAVHSVCPLCGIRKAKRDCPGVGHMICAVCCGTKRLVEIPCPASCPYLASSRSHPAAVVQRRRDRDLEFFVPLIADLSEPQSRLVLLLQSVVVRHAADAVPAVLDADIAEAAAAVAATLETARKGVIYEHEAATVPARRLAAALRDVLKALNPGAANLARLETDSAIALRRIEQGARTAAGALEGDPPPPYLGVLRRLVPEVTGDAVAGDAEAEGGSNAGGPLIIPG